MKIKKSPPKKLASPPPAMKKLIQELNEQPESEISKILASFDAWPFPRGDLFLWISVLNRFDTILEKLCERYELKKHVQKEPFADNERQTLLAILRFTKLLLENCTNRNLYNSYEHLNDILNTFDHEVLETTLWLLLRPAQRLSQQRSLRANFVIQNERIMDLASAWSTEDESTNLYLLSTPDAKIPMDLNNFHYSFYRFVKQHKGSDENVSAEAENRAVPETPTPIHRRESLTSGASSGGAAGSSSEVKEGMTTITIINPRQHCTSERNLFDQIVEQYSVPEEFHFGLLHRVRLSLGVSDPKTRLRLLTIRILAIAIAVHMYPENEANAKLFLYEPELVTELADLIHPEKHVFMPIQIATLYALEALARYRSKLNEVLSALQASANHGILLSGFRKLVTNLENNTNLYPQEYVDAFFFLLTYIVSTQSGGTMLISAGIITTLLQLLQNKNSSHAKVITKAVSMLDSIVYGFTNSFSVFINANGLSILIGRVKEEVEFCTQFINTEGEPMQDVQLDAPAGAIAERTIPSETSDDSSVPHERISLLKGMLKFILHMMVTTGTADGLRNVIDSSLPQSLKLIIAHPKPFGSSVFAQAINILATIIHNEPTSLTMLQEAQLPQTFLKTVNAEILVSSDVINAIPNAFGAICLNSQGLEMFKEANPIPNFFSILISKDHLRSLMEGNNASLLGSSIEELIRHQPSLRIDVLNAALEIIKRIIDFGQSEQAKQEDTGYRLHVKPANETVTDIPMTTSEQPSRVAAAGSAGESEDAKPEEKPESLILQFIEVLSKFLESLFQNSTNCREFIKLDGLEQLLQILLLPSLPYDFATTNAHYLLSHVFNIASEVNPSVVANAIIKGLHESLENTKRFLEYNEPGSLLATYLVLEESETTKIEDANNTFRSLLIVMAHIGLLADLYCPPIFSHSKSAATVVQSLAGPQGEEVIALLGQLHRACVRECIHYKDVVPSSWFKDRPNKDAKDLTTPAFALSDPFAPENLPLSPKTTDPSNKQAEGEESKEGEAELPVSKNDPKYKNALYLKYMTLHLSTCLQIVFQGVCRMLVTRRGAEPQQKKQASKVADIVAKVMKDSILWPRIDTEPEPKRYRYLGAMLGLICLMFVDERSHMTLQTIVVLAFDRAGGFESMFDLIRILWQRAIELSSQADQSDEVKTTLDHLHKAIGVSLHLLHIVISHKLLHDSPSTNTLISRDKDRAADSFDPYEHLVMMRAKVLPVVREIWNSEYLPKSTPSIHRILAQILVQILKGEGEINQTAESSSSFGNSAPTLFGWHPPPPPPPPESSIRQLTDMGFPTGAAETALMRCGNSVARAAEYLLSHPDMVAAAAFDESSGERRNTNSDTPGNRATTGEGGGEGEQDTNGRDNEGGETEDHAEDDPENAEASAGGPSSERNPESSSMPVEIGGDAPMTELTDSSDNEEARFLREALELSMGTPSSNQPSESDAKAPAPEKDKGKAKEIEKSYHEMREAVKQEIGSRALELLDVSEQAIFEITDLFTILCKDNTIPTIKLLISDVVEPRDRSIDEEQWKKLQHKLHSRFRLLALILNGSKFQEEVLTVKENLLPPLIDLIELQFATGGDAVAEWITPLLLVVEVFLSMADEPRAIEVEHTEDADIKRVEKPEEREREARAKVSDEVRLKLLKHCIELLRLPQPPKDFMLALLRVLVRLTRQHRFAAEFVQSGGLPLLFSLPRSGAEGFVGQEPFIILILRHAVDDPQVLQNTMEREVNTWFAPPRPRVVDVTTFLRNNSHIALRDPETFLRVTRDLCKLPANDMMMRSQQITLKSNSRWADDASLEEEKGEEKPLEGESMEAEEQDKKDKEEGESSSKAEATVAPETSMFLQPQPFETPKPQEGISAVVINFLIDELLNHRAKKKDAAPPSSDSIFATPSKPSTSLQDTAMAESSASVPAVGETGAAGSKPDEKDDKGADAASKAREGQFMYTCFLLQCLTELLSSYPVCKINLMNFSRRGEDTSTWKPRTVFLNYLLNDLLPYEGVDLSDEPRRNRYTPSNWATNTLVALCSDGPDLESDENTKSKELRPGEVPPSELQHVRRFVLDGIARSLKDTMHAPSLMEIKYGKLMALSDVCYRILTTRPPPQSSAGKPADAPSSAAKLMLEKNFVGLLTSALGEVDFNYPAAKNVISTILRPLEQLTRIAIKMSRSDEGKARRRRRRRAILADEEDEDEDDEEEFYENTEDEEEVEEEEEEGEEAPDLYRNSSLGMIAGGGIESAEEGEEDTSEDEEIYEEYTEGTPDSDMSDVSEEEGTGDEGAEMDIVIAPFHHHHHHHHHHHALSDEELDDAVVDWDGDEDEEEEMWTGTEGEEEEY
ncbi:uncharacterized protein VTP21DRAFT_11160 [Calcarisporiella thermophila]|uniref:uncharacterized protein n=1 Tax=Calcarisporiella thermophila TaxID=911321 RepID=UPI0037437526